MAPDETELAALRADLEDLRTQLRELRLVVATIHPEYFDIQRNRKGPKGGLWVVEGGIAGALFYALRKTLRPVALIATSSAITATAILLPRLAAPGPPPGGLSEPPPYVFRIPLGHHKRRRLLIRLPGPVGQPVPVSTITITATPRPTPEPSPTQTISPSPKTSPPTASPTAIPSPSPTPTATETCVEILGVTICVAA